MVNKTHDIADMNKFLVFPGRIDNSFSKILYLWKWARFYQVEKVEMTP